ncbi:MAG: hypothetical protein P1S60_17075 [Anaerolineae bacterium]|nr:hypothetical protein [Anaerolineae bacterium]
MPMHSDFTLYVSAASDLRYERDLLGRIAAEIPVDLGWRTILSPTSDGLLDIGSIQNADIHLMLLGGDVRAPIGQEWILATQAGRVPIPYLKTGILRTSAATDFARFISTRLSWKPFESLGELRKSVLLDISSQLIQYAHRYHLRLPDVENIQNLQTQLDKTEEAPEENPAPNTDSSSVILSSKAAATRGGIVIQRD